jgi:hypothetical protein
MEVNVNANDNVDTNDNEQYFKFKHSYFTRTREQIIADQTVLHNFYYLRIARPPGEEIVYKISVNEILDIFSLIIWLTNNGAFEITFANVDTETLKETGVVRLLHFISKEGKRVIYKYVKDESGYWMHELNENEINDILRRHPRNNE